MMSGTFKAPFLALALLLHLSAEAQIVPRTAIIENDALKRYLDNSDYNPHDYSYSSIGLFIPAQYARLDRPEPVVFNLPYALRGKELVLEILEDERDPVPVQTLAISPESTGCSVYNLAPGRLYCYRLKDPQSKRIVESGDFFVEGRRRMIRADNVRNIRDMGGLRTEDGATLAYGRLFRGGAMDNARGAIRDTLFDKSGWTVLHDDLFIRADIDLRSDRELLLTDNNPYNDMSQSPLGADVGHYHFPISDFGFITVGNMYGPVISCIVERLERGENVYFHCAQGADRTGVLAFLLGGMAGVCETDLARDYELTCFALCRTNHTRCSVQPYNYGPSVQYIKNNFQGETLARKIQDYLIKMHGVSPHEIESFRSIMVEE